MTGKSPLCPWGYACDLKVTVISNRQGIFLISLLKLRMFETLINGLCGDMWYWFELKKNMNGGYGLPWGTAAVTSHLL